MNIVMYDSVVSGSVYGLAGAPTGLFRRLAINGQRFPNTAFTISGTTLTLHGTIGVDFAGTLLQLDYV